MAPVAPEDDGWSRAGAAALCLSGTRLTYATGAVLTEGSSSTRPAPTLLFQSSHNVSQTGSCEPAMRLRWKHDIMGFLGRDITFPCSVIPSFLRHLKYLHQGRVLLKCRTQGCRDLCTFCTTAGQTVYLEKDYSLLDLYIIWLIFKQIPRASFGCDEKTTWTVSPQTLFLCVRWCIKTFSTKTMSCCVWIIESWLKKKNQPLSISQ